MTQPSVVTAQPVPERPALPLVGHALSLPKGFAATAHMMKEVRELGPVYRVRAFGTELVIVGGLDLVAELADESRFRKNVHPELVDIRQFAGDGLFTAFNHEPNWRKAHDILMPAFSLGAMRDYHATMLRVARSLIGKWDQAAGRRAVDVPGDMTRLTFDTIGLCGFGYDFESFRQEDPHPFVEAMTRALAFTQAKGEAIPGSERFWLKRSERFRQDVTLMTSLVDEVIRQRRRSGGSSTGDLLGRMLHTPDARTGRPLDDVNIRNQVITFLIAGHETTSGALSFALYYLTKHPEVLARAQAEVDALWGDAETPGPAGLRHRRRLPPPRGVRGGRGRRCRQHASHLHARARRRCPLRPGAHRPGGADEVWAVLEAGGKVYVCGDGRRMAPAVREAFTAIHRRRTGADEEEAARWLVGLVESGRYVEDVWAG